MNDAGTFRANSEFKFCCFFLGISFLVLFLCFLPITPCYPASYQNPYNHIRGRTFKGWRRELRGKAFRAAVPWGVLMQKS